MAAEADTGVVPRPSRRRVGKIELLRFLIACSIVFFHLNGFVFGHGVRVIEMKPVSLSLFWHANVGVEFFFLVSGYLMARGIASQRARAQAAGVDPNEHLAQDTVSFVVRKAKPILRYSLPFAAWMCVIHIAESEDPFAIKWYLDSMPSLLFIEKTGIGDSAILGVDWYVSSLLLASAALYPICRRYGDVFTHVYAPLVGLFMVGYMLHRDGGSLGSGKWYLLINKCNVRAASELMLGCSIYPASEWLKRQKLSTSRRALLSLIEFAAYFLTACYMCSDLPYDYDGNALLFLWVGVTLSFAQQGLGGHAALFENRFCDYLGALSLPIFLGQYVAMHTVRLLVPEGLRGRTMCLLMFAAALVLAVVAYALSCAADRRQRRSAV